MFLHTYIALLTLALVSAAIALDNRVAAIAKTSPSIRAQGQVQHSGKQQRYPAKKSQQRDQVPQNGQAQKHPGRQRVPNRNINNAGTPWLTPSNNEPQNVYDSQPNQLLSETVPQQGTNSIDNTGPVFPWYTPPNYDPQYLQWLQNNQLNQDGFQPQIPFSASNQVAENQGNLRKTPVYIIYVPYPMSTQAYPAVGMNQRFPYPSDAFMCTPNNQLYKMRVPFDLSKLKSYNPNITFRLVPNSKLGFPGGYATPYVARQLCQTYLPGNGAGQISSLSNPGFPYNTWGMPQISVPMGYTNPGAPNLIPSNAVNIPSLYNPVYDPNSDMPYDSYSDDEDDSTSLFTGDQ